MGTNPDSPKAKLRFEMKSIIKEVGGFSLKEKSESLVDTLVTLLKSNITKDHFNSSKPSCVGVFAPIKGEPNVISLGKHFDLAFPSLEEDIMVFRKAKFEELVETKDFGVKIYTPLSDAQLVKPDVLVIPGLAFDRTGSRLGRGKGFYDRYLENFQGVKIGVCFKEQIVSTVPCEKHDVVMNYIISDGECFSENQVLSV